MAGAARGRAHSLCGARHQWPLICVPPVCGLGADHFNGGGSINGPAFDLVPVTPSASADLGFVATGLYVQSGGQVTFKTRPGKPAVSVR
ncbi:spike base protein, RCAP_Rcc01079 family [Pseudophaeobacter leonis]|uniref:spike base protein, RCAP_Rcc01079 family n=1 Tax=Pseudophaeobacter leonis TaxID=1144477 RepID=UPI003B97E871